MNLQWKVIHFLWSGKNIYVSFVFKELLRQDNAKYFIAGSKDDLNLRLAGSTVETFPELKNNYAHTYNNPANIFTINSKYHAKLK